VSALNSASPSSGLSVTQVLEQREQGALAPAALNDLAAAASGALLAKAFEALDAESADCLSYLSLAIERAASAQDARVCCAIALVILDLDSGTLANVAGWIERYNHSKDAQIVHPIAQLWAWLGDVVAHSYDENVISQERLRASANGVLENFGALGGSISADTQVIAGQMLLNYARDQGEPALVDFVASIVTHPKLLAHTQPVTQARFFEELGFAHFGLNHPAQAKAHWQTALDIAEKCSLVAAGFMARIGLCRQLLDEQEYAAAEKIIQGFRLAEGFGRGYAVVTYKHLRARHLLLKKNANAANVDIDDALALARRIGVPSNSLHMCLQEKAQILFALNKAEQAETLLNDADELEVGASGTAVKANAQLIRFLRLADSDTHAAGTALSEGLALASSIGFARFLRSIPEAAAKVCKAALEHGVHTDFVRQAIAERRLPAPEGTGELWPWPLRIRVLGSLAVELNDQPLTFPGRTQAKPMELLCYLATSTELRADNHSICAALWEQDDLAKAGKSLETTVSRLRKLLGRDSFVRVAGHHVLLDAGAVWCDWAHMRFLAAQLTGAAATPAHRARDRVAQLAKELLACYRGPLLTGSEETPWLLGRRDDAVQRFVAAALAAKAGWPADEGTQALVSFLESALLHEPLSEGLALALMQHYATHDQPADAMRVYRFFRNQLSLRTGLKPGAAVEAYKQTLMV
jgi:DNA-binding SARP family transcriptional activator